MFDFSAVHFTVMPKGSVWFLKMLSADFTVLVLYAANHLELTLMGVGGAQGWTEISEINK